MKPQAQSRPPYSFLASYYQEVMGTVDYKKWARMLITGIQKHKLSWDIVLEMACGTGCLAQELNKQKYPIHLLSDLSIEMLLETQKRKSSSFFFVSHLDSPPIQENSLSGVLCCFDSIHYLLYPNQVLSSLNGLYNAVKPGGWLYIDTLCLKSAQEGEFDWSEFDTFGNCDIVHQSWFEEEFQFQHNDFIFFTPSNDNPQNYKRYTENHCEWIWSESEFLNWLQLSQWQILECGYDLNWTSPPENYVRKHWLLQKKAL